MVQACLERLAKLRRAGPEASWPGQPGAREVIDQVGVPLSELEEGQEHVQGRRGEFFADAGGEGAILAGAEAVDGCGMPNASP